MSMRGDPASHPADQVNRFDILDQETAGTRPQRLENVLVQIEGREDNDLDLFN